MQIRTRFSGPLARQVGIARLTVTLPDNATVGDLVTWLRQQYPGAGARLDATVAIIGGRHVPLTEPLSDGQEVALLLPIAGGCC